MVFIKSITETYHSTYETLIFKANTTALILLEMDNMPLVNFQIGSMI